MKKSTSTITRAAHRRAMSKLGRIVQIQVYQTFAPIKRDLEARIDEQRNRIVSMRDELENAKTVLATLPMRGVLDVLVSKLRAAGGLAAELTSVAPIGSQRALASTATAVTYERAADMLAAILPKRPFPPTSAPSVAGASPMTATQVNRSRLPLTPAQEQSLIDHTKKRLPEIAAEAGKLARKVSR